MANLSASYDKIVLGVALVIALGLGAMVYLNAGKLDEDFTPATSPRPSMPDLPKIEAFKSQTAKVGLPVTIKPPIDGERTINNFVGTPTFLTKDGDRPVDLGDPSNPPVHKGIPNKWWLDNRIEPGFADSPDRDPDNDGFTNREEFEAETNPNNSKEHPTLIAKLECATLEKKPFRIAYSSDTAAGAFKPEDKFRFKFEDVLNGRRRSINSDWIKPGKGPASRFFAKGPAQLRFELKSVEQRKVKNPRNGLMETISFALIEDVSPNKKGDKHEIMKGSKNGIVIRDWTAGLFLNAVGEADKVVKVDERTSFSLPLDPDAAVKPFLFKEVNANNEVVIEWKENGETKSRILTPNKPVK